MGERGLEGEGENGGEILGGEDMGGAVARM